jgi:NDP-sugar pyrophosphorylase family protein
MKALIPCAGYGTRMRMQPHEAKELLPDENGKPTIEWSLNICREYNIEPVIITRKEKIEFINYLENNNIQYVIGGGESTGESLLNAKEYWDDYNIMILPDTRFNYPKNLFIDIFKCMKAGNDCVFALFNVEDHSNWGIICENVFYEKPKRTFTEKDNAYAWGIIGFRKEYGETLLNSYNTTSEPLKLNNPGYLFINNFRDISRKYTNI